VVEFDFEGFAEFQGVPSMVFTRILDKYFSFLYAMKYFLAMNEETSVSLNLQNDGCYKKILSAVRESRGIINVHGLGNRSR